MKEGSSLRKALLLGYYGYGNLGDELMFEASKKILKETGFREIFVPYPQQVKSREFIPIRRYNPISLMLNLKKSHILFLGGGGILQDETSLRSMLYYSMIIEIFSLLKRKVILFGNSLGPLRNKISKCLVRDMLRRKNVYFFARDIVTYRYANMIGKNVFLGSDPSILVLKDMKISSEKKNKIIFILKEKIPVLPIMMALKELADFEFCVLNVHPDDVKDYPGLKRCEDDPIKEITSSSLIISQRFHPNLIAAFFGIPFVSVGEKKTERFLRRYIPNYEGFASKDYVEIALKSLKIVEKDFKPLEDILINDALEMKGRVEKILLTV